MSRQAAFDKVALGELTINVITDKQLVGKFKLVDSKTGKSFGSTTMNAWSANVWQKFNELREALEEEAENILFEEGDTPAISAAKGLGELFSDESGSV